MLEKLDPYYEKHVFLCTNVRPEGHLRGCCQGKGTPEMRDYLRDKVKTAGLDRIRINTAGCMDRCELGPVLVIYPEGVWYRPVSKADLDEIFTSHILNNTVVERLILDKPRS